MIGTVIDTLKGQWRNSVERQYETKDEMLEGLIHLIAHDNHIWADEGDELTGELARMMNYDIDNMTNAQWHEWHSIVDAAAIQYVYEAIEEWLPDDWANRPHSRIFMVNTIYNYMLRNHKEYGGIAEAAESLGYHGAEVTK